MNGDDVFKRCPCDEAKWTKCAHPWYLSQFRWQGKAHTPNLTRWAKLTRHEDVTTKTRAEELAEALRASIRAGEYVSAKVLSTTRVPTTPGQTVERLIALFDENVIQLDPHKRDTSKRGDRGNLDKFAAFTPTPGRRLGDQPLSAITVADLIAFRNSPRLVGAANRTWAGYRTNLSQLCEWAKSEGHIEADPFAALTKAQAKALKRGTQSGRSRRIDEAEEGALVTAAGRARDERVATRLQSMIVAAIETGLRLGELLALQWRDVDLAGRGLFVRAEEIGAAKTRTPRRVPLSQRVADELGTLTLDPAGKPFGRTAYVFGDAVGGRVKDVRKAWESTVLRAHGHEPTWTGSGGGLNRKAQSALATIDLHFHDLRHEAGSRWLESKAFDLKTIGEMLGHADVTTTARYLHARSTSATTSMQQFDALRQRAGAAATAAVGSSGAHKLHTNRKTGSATSAGPRLVKGRNSRGSL